MSVKLTTAPDTLTTLLEASLVVEMKNDRIKLQNDMIQKQQALIILLMSNVQAVHDNKDKPTVWGVSEAEEFVMTHNHLAENGFHGFSGFAEEMQEIIDNQF